MFQVSRHAFERMVWEAVDRLPESLRERINNLDIIVRTEASEVELAANHVLPGQTLMGLYTGVPLIKRGTNYDLVMPDLITIYQWPHEAIAGNLEDLAGKVRHTVHHEIAHHFGISDERLHELGAY
jgi:predicted Zn-dependent protease with MMP-like domain